MTDLSDKIRWLAPDGFNEFIDRRAALEAAGPHPGDDWVCEQHPDQPWPHDDCLGPGMPVRDARCPECGGELHLSEDRYEYGDGRWLVCEDCAYENRMPASG